MPLKKISAYAIKEKVEIFTGYIKDISSREIADNIAAAYSSRGIRSKTAVLKM